MALPHVLVLGGRPEDFEVYIVRHLRGQKPPVPYSLAIACLQDEFDPDRAILARPHYAQVRHLLRPDVLSFAKALCGHCADSEDGGAIREYLSALTGIEDGAVFRDLCGTASLEFLLTSQPVHCDSLDQIQLFHFLSFCSSPPLPHLPVELPKIPTDGYFTSWVLLHASTAASYALSGLPIDLFPGLAGKFGFAHAAFETRHSPAALCALALGHCPLNKSARLCGLLNQVDFCPRPRAVRFERWTEAIEEVLTARTPKFRVIPHTYMMLELRFV
ncbi:hypothetical protein T492DRAFT_863192 [Pavlovales sp. CCMP2436]|nr:hypothetical protein T492DRAFT_863192 [Pavlovales sp. CCMP2436]